MTSLVRRLTVLVVLLGLVNQPSAAQQTTVSNQMESWYSTAQRKAPGTWGVVVADASGKVLWSVNAHSPLIPASTVKLLTTGFARSQVGGDARRPTRVVGEGAVDPSNGEWSGDWALQLNGDPSLERSSMGGPSLSSLAEQLYNIGVRKLTGPLNLTTMDGTAKSLYPVAWPDRHRGRTYAPPIGPITLNENLVVLSVTPGIHAGDPPVVTTSAPRGVSGLFDVQAKTVAGGRNRLSIRTSGDGWLVRGTIGVRARAGGYTVVAHNPAAVAEAAWSNALQEAGIEWDQTATPTMNAFPTGQRVLAEIVSPTFDSIAANVNTNSINIGAELMLRWGGGPNQPAQKLQQHVLQATGLMEGVHLVDGSGLSDKDRVAPLVFTTYLAKFPTTEAGHNFPFLLPANGSGTLRSLATGLPERGVVRAKTGTLGNAATLVGYLGQSDGMLLVAAMYNGGYISAARQQQWSLFRTLGVDGVMIPEDADLPVEYPLVGR